MAYTQLFLILFIVSNSIVHLTAQYYTPIPHPGTQLQAALKRSFILKCEYTGGGDPEFLEWYKKNATHDVPVNTDKPGHYIVKQTKNESKLEIKIFVNADANVTKWYLKTKRYDNACQFGQIKLIPSPQGILDDKGVTSDAVHGSIRRTEDQLIRLKCLIEPENTQGNRIQWEFSSKDEHHFGDLPDDIIRPVDKIDEIEINPIKKYHRGFYRCTLNRVSFTILLRVKDRLAALWPFIGIVSIVLILVIIILIFERQQKKNKKPNATDDDDQDRASDPLVRTSTKTDNDNRKRTIKA